MVDRDFGGNRFDRSSGNPQPLAKTMIWWKCAIVSAFFRLPPGPEYFSFDIRGQRSVAWIRCPLCGRPFPVRFSVLRKRKKCSHTLRFCEECRKKQQV